MKKLLLLIPLIFIVSCNTLKNDKKKVAKIDARHPVLIAEVCAKNFKSIDSIREVIKYIPGEPTIKIEKVRVNLDSLIRTIPPDTITRFIDIICPPSLIRIDTVLSDKTITSTHSANIYLLEKTQDSLHLVIINQKGEIITKDNKISKKNKHILILTSILGLLGLGFLVKLYLKFKP